MTIPSVTTRGFWEAFRSLPRDVQQRAKVAYGIWARDPFHPSLHFKKLKGTLWSVRVGKHYRAVGHFEHDLLIWIWIGSHADYDRLLR